MFKSVIFYVLNTVASQIVRSTPNTTNTSCVNPSSDGVVAAVFIQSCGHKTK